MTDEVIDRGVEHQSGTGEHPMSNDPQNEALAHWPGSWPGQTVVNLDNLGDAGYWIEERTGEIYRGLSGDTEDLEEAAGILADHYIADAAAMKFPMPTDFGMSDEECKELVTSDFRSFLLEWRRRLKDSTNEKA